MTSGYRCVNYFELCRLCTSSAGVKTPIFSEEGRKKDLVGKIGLCLPVKIEEEDRLPKILCASCLTQVETIARFRETCLNAQTMLESCLNSSKLRTGGKVYIKDVSSRKAGTSVAPTLISATPMLTKTTTVVNRQQRIIGQTSVSSTNGSGATNQSQQQLQQKSTTSSDFLSSIIQAVGINSVDTDSGTDMVEQQTTTTYMQTTQQQPQQQYTITLDGQTIQSSNQIHYKIEPANMITVQQQQPQVQVQQQQFQQQQSAPKPAQPPKLSQLQLRQQQLRQRQQQQQSNSSTTTNLSTQMNEFLRLKSNPKVSIKKKLPPGKILAKRHKPNTLYVVANNSAVASNGQQQQPQQQQQQLVTRKAPSIQVHQQIITPAGNQQQLQQQVHQLQLQPQQTATLIATTNASPNQKSMQLSQNKCYVPITLKNDKQIHFMEMKINPELTTIDGQIVQLSQAGNQLTLTAAPQQQQQQQQQLQLVQQQPQLVQTSSPMQTYRTVSTSSANANGNHSSTTTNSPTETKTIFTTSTGQSVTITHAPLSSLNGGGTTTTYQQQQQQQQSQPNTIEQHMQQMQPMQIIRVKNIDGSNATLDGHSLALDGPTTLECVQLTPLQNVQQQQQTQTTGDQQRTVSLKPGITIQRIKTSSGGGGGQQLQQQRKPITATASTATTSTTSTATGQIVAVRRVLNSGSGQQPKGLPVLHKLQRTVVAGGQTVAASSGTRPAIGRPAGSGAAAATTSGLKMRPKLTRVLASGSGAKQSGIVRTVPSVNRQTPSAAATPSVASQKTPANAVRTATKTSPNTSTGSAGSGAASSAGGSSTSPAARSAEAKTGGGGGGGGGGDSTVEGGTPTCHICDKVFKRKEHLAQHAKLHLGLRPFKCQEPGCNKSFSRKEHLLRHVVSHTGKKMFNCEFCQKLFSRKDNLNKHKRSHVKTETASGIVYTIVDQNTSATSEDGK